MNLNLTKSKSVSDLTKDDSKILGESTTKKLEMLSNKDHFNTKQFQTVYSNWTPVSNKSYNKTIFKERKELIFNWFDIWTDEQRKEFLLELFNKFSPNQFVCVYDYFDKKIPLKRVDFTRILSRSLSLKIFSYLDPRSLSRSSRVCWHWKFIAEQDILWIRKCRTFGWYLPYTPSESEFGAWKRHYVSNAISVDMSVGQIRGSVWRRLALTEEIKASHDVNQKQKKGSSTIDDIIKSAVTKPQWAVSSVFPKDIEHATKALFAGVNPNECISQIDLNEYNISMKPIKSIKSPKSTLTPKNIKDKITLTNLLSWEERRMNELVDNKTESIIQGSDIVKCGNSEPLPWQIPHLNNMYQLQSIASGYSGWTNPRVIFISSKLPAAEMLLDSVIFGVIPIPYDYDSSTLKTMIYDLKSVLRGRRAKSIGIFGHRNRENEMWIVKNKCFSRKNSTTDHTELQEFINNLAANVLPKNEYGHIDLFSPFGAFTAGIEMLFAMNELTQSTFIAPISVIGNYKFILGEWTIQIEKDVHPCFAYFSINKLNAWVEFSDTINEICENTKTYLKNQYPEIDEFLLKQLTGSIVREASLKNPEIDIENLTRNLWKTLSNDEKTCEGFNIPHLNTNISNPFELEKSTDKNKDKIKDKNKEIDKKNHKVKNKDEDGDQDDKNKNNDKDKDKDKDNDKVKDKDKNKDKDKDNDKVKDKDKDQDEDKNKDKNKNKDKKKNEKKEKNKDKDKSKDKKKDKNNEKDKNKVKMTEKGNEEHDGIPVPLPNLVIQSKYSMRESIVRQLVLSEKRHLQILKCINDCYHTPLKRALLSNRTILGPHNIQVIFGDILVFTGPSEILITNLENRLKHWSPEECIGDVLENHINDILTLFGTFFVSYNNSLLTIERCRETNLKFRNFLAIHDNQPESGMLTLNELFLQPINRILEYMSIIHWILSNTPPEHEDIVQLRKSLGGLTKINRIVVQEKSRINRSKIFKDLEDSITNCPILAEPGRYFVAKENLCLYMPSNNAKSIDPDLRLYQQARDCGFFLFNDSVIITRITRELQPYFRSVIHNHSFEKALCLPRLSLFDVPDRKDIRNAFQIQCGSKSWIFGCNSIEKKYHLTTILREYIQTPNNIF